MSVITSHSAFHADPFTFIPSEQDLTNWMTIPGNNSTTWSEYDAKMLLFSNEGPLKEYLADNLWSEDYNTSIHAEGYNDYTDGYTARIEITFLYEMLDETLDGFGLILSQHGY